MEQDHPDWVTNPNTDIINLYDEHELIYWTNKWKISENQLLEAYSEAGSSIIKRIHDALCDLGYVEREP